MELHYAMICKKHSSSLGALGRLLVALQGHLEWVSDQSLSYQRVSPLTLETPHVPFSWPATFRQAASGSNA